MNLTLFAILIIMMGLLLWWFWLSNTKHTDTGKGVEDYFKNAARVYCGIQEYGAKLAALPAAQTATPNQRETLFSHLASHRQSLKALVQQGPGAKAFQARWEDLTQAIHEQDWTSQNHEEAKQELELFSSDYHKALMAEDPLVFARNYPTLFQTSTLKDLMTESTQLIQADMNRNIQDLEKFKTLKGLDEDKREHLETVQRELKKYLKNPNTHKIYNSEERHKKTTMEHSPLYSSISRSPSYNTV